MRTLFSEMKELYNTDRKEFWDVIGGGTIWVVTCIVMWWVITPLFYP
jgi:hypothetical protein